MLFYLFMSLMPFGHHITFDISTRNLKMELFGKNATSWKYNRIKIALGYDAGKNNGYQLIVYDRTERKCPNPWHRILLIFQTFSFLDYPSLKITTKWPTYLDLFGRNKDGYCPYYKLLILAMDNKHTKPTQGYSKDMFVTNMLTFSSYAWVSSLNIRFDSSSWLFTCSKSPSLTVKHDLKSWTHCLKLLTASLSASFTLFRRAISVLWSSTSWDSFVIVESYEANNIKSEVEFCEPGG